MMIPGGGIVVMQPNSGDFDKYASSAPGERKASQVPTHLECSLCKNLLQDAVLIPCCANNFCDSCKIILLFILLQVERIFNFYVFE
jgi:hypothetical protein